MVAKDPAALARELVESVKPVSDDFLRQAELNERFVNGDQFGASFYRNGRLEVERELWGSRSDQEELPRVSVNLLDPIFSTWVSLLVGDRLISRCEAASQEPVDVYKSIIQQAFLEWWARDQDTAVKSVQTVRLAGMHGTAANKVFWDPVDGCVKCGVVSIFDYFRDPTPDYRDARWVVYIEYLSQDEAAEEMIASGIENPDPVQTTYKTVDGEERKGVERLELWMKPNRDYPQGLMAVSMGGEIVEQTQYPYVFEVDGRLKYVLPHVEMKVRDVRGSPYGRTPLTAAVPIQRRVNETHASIAKWLERIRNVHVIVPDDLADTFDPSIDQMIRYRSATTNGVPPTIGYTKPPPVPGDLYESLDRYERLINGVMGVDDSIVGDGKVRSGKALENSRRLDASKNADVRRQYEDMILERDKFALLLAGRYYTTPQKAKITGMPVVDMVMFTGDDLKGVDVKLERGSELDHDRYAKEEMAVQRRQFGLMTDFDWRQVVDRPGAASARASAEMLVEQYLAMPLPDPRMVPLDGADAEMLLAVIEQRKASAMSVGDRRTWSDLEQLARFVRAQAGQAQQQPGQQPPQSNKNAPDMAPDAQQPIPDPTVV